MTNRVAILLMGVLCCGGALSAQEKGAFNLATAKPEAAGMSSVKLAKVDDEMAKLIEKQRLAGGVVMIARGGKIVHFKAYGQRDQEAELPMEQDTIFRIYSMTKAITTAAALMLYEEGKIGLDDPLSKHIPALKKLQVQTKDGLVAPKREATVADLMRHTAGMTYGGSKFPVADKAYRDAKMMNRDIDLKTQMENMASVPLVFQPGTDWNYGVAIDVLGRVVEVASGQPLDSFFQERVFQPLGMQDTGFYVPDKKLKRFAASYNYRDGKLTLADAPADSRYRQDPAFKSGGGGLCSTASDYMRFLLMIQQQGQLGGQRLLKPETARLMTTNQVPKDVGWIKFGEVREGVGFGFGFSVREKMSDWDPQGRLGEYGWGGAASTHYWVSPRDDLIVVTMEQVKPYSFGTEFALKGLIYDAIVD